MNVMSSAASVTAPAILNVHNARRDPSCTLQPATPRVHQATLKTLRLKSVNLVALPVMTVKARSQTAQLVGLATILRTILAEANARMVSSSKSLSKNAFHVNLRAQLVKTQRTIASPVNHLNFINSINAEIPVFQAISLTILIGPVLRVSSIVRPV